MQVFDLVEQAQSGHAMANLAATFGIGEDEARAATRAVVSELGFAIERNTLSRGGLADLVHAIGQGHHDHILEDPDTWRDPRVTADGSAIVANILGSEGKSRVLAARAARASGLGEGLIQMLLPIIAQLLMGALSKYAKGGLGDILSRLPIPGGSPRQPPDTRADFDTGGRMGERGGFDLPQVELPTGGGYPMPPMPDDPTGDPRSSRHGSGGRGGYQMPWPGGSPTPNRDPEGDGEGNRRWGREAPRSGRGGGGGFDLPQVDLPSGGGYPMPPMPPSPDGATPSTEGSRNRSPFPLPGPGQTDNPYGDLSDILRRGGRVPTGDGSNGGLWGVVRRVLGNALGFGQRGWIGWIVQLIVMRWGWRILQRLVFGR